MLVRICKRCVYICSSIELIRCLVWSNTLPSFLPGPRRMWDSLLFIHPIYRTQTLITMSQCWQTDNTQSIKTVATPKFQRIQKEQHFDVVHFCFTSSDLYLLACFVLCIFSLLTERQLQLIYKLKQSINVCK